MGIYPFDQLASIGAGPLTDQLASIGAGSLTDQLASIGAASVIGATRPRGVDETQARLSKARLHLSQPVFSTMLVFVAVALVRHLASYMAVENPVLDVDRLTEHWISALGVALAWYSIAAKRAGQ